MGDSTLKLRVNAPSRLHFGIIDMRGDLGRIHGSVGVAIEHPRLVLEIKESSETVIRGARSGRAAEIIAHCDHLGIFLGSLDQFPISYLAR